MDGTIKHLIWLTQGFCLLMGLCLAGLSESVSLGSIKVYSYLNEALDAEITLTASPEETDKLLIAIAPQDEFNIAGITKSPTLSKLNFQLMQDEDELFILANSEEPITDPYLDFLLDVSSPHGRLIRRYTILLDPVPITGKPVSVRRRHIPHAIEEPTQVVSVPAPPSKSMATPSLPTPILPGGTKPEEILPLKSGQNPLTPISPSTQTVTPKTEEQAHLQALFNNEQEPKPIEDVVNDIEAILTSESALQAKETKAAAQKPKTTAEKTPPSVTSPPESVKAPPIPTPVGGPGTPHALEPSLITKTPWEPSREFILTVTVLVLALILGLDKWRKRRAEARRKTVKDLILKEREERAQTEPAPSPETSPAETQAPTPPKPEEGLPELETILAEQPLPQQPHTPTSPLSPDAHIGFGTPEVPEVEEIEIPPPSSSGNPLPSSPPAVENETDLKLSLAKQYLDMGDLLGAKDLLNSVLESGSAEQKARAEALLQHLSI